MKELEDARICLFCREAEERVGDERKHWFVRENDYPYEGAAAHYLIVSRLHVNSFDELPNDAGAELWDIRRELKSMLGSPAFATVERSGDTSLNGGSVDHLHVHLVALEPDPPTTVRFRVSAHGLDEVSGARRNASDKEIFAMGAFGAGDQFTPDAGARS